jgi:uncharacterized cupin superfamily protein
MAGTSLTASVGEVLESQEETRSAQYLHAMKKIDLAAVRSITRQAIQNRSMSPAAAKVASRAQGLTLFGVNLTVIPPGGWSSQRHWHSHEDEFVWVVEGELTLVTNAGEEILRPGDCAAFKAGDPDGHHLVNRSDRPAKVLEIGNSDPKDRCVYSDIDMVAGPGAAGYSHRDGTPCTVKAQ